MVNSGEQTLISFQFEPTCVICHWLSVIFASRVLSCWILQKYILPCLPPGPLMFIFNQRRCCKNLNFQSTVKSFPYRRKMSLMSLVKDRIFFVRGTFSDKKDCTFSTSGWFVVEATELFSFSQNHLSTSYCLPLTLKAQQKEKGPYELKITVFPNFKLVPFSLILNVNLVAILLIYFA